MRIIIIVFTNLFHDSRVRKQVEELRDNELTVICLDSKYTDKLQLIYHDVNFHFLKRGTVSQSKSFLQYIEREWILKADAMRVLKFIDADRIIANDFEALLPAYFGSIHKAKQIIYDSHEIWTEREGCKKTFLHRIVNSIELKLESMIVKKIRRIVTVSKPIADFLRSKWNYEGRMDVIRNIPQEGEPLDIKREQFNIPEGNTVLVYIGFISKRRNIDKLIKAFPKETDLTLLLIGSATRPLHHLIDERRNVIHIERIPPEKITGYLRLADIGIHPLNTSISLNHKYALPNKLFQYMQAGLALCIFDGPSVKPIITECNNGIYGCMNSIEEISLMIEKILIMNIKTMKHNSQTSIKNICKTNYCDLLIKSL